MKFAPDKHGFSLSTDDVTQGYATSTEELVAPIEGHFHPVLSVTTSEDNKGSCGSPDLPVCFDNHSIISFSGSRRDFFDVDVSQSGTKSDSQSIVPANEVRHYAYDGGKYVEQAPTE